MKVEFNHYTKPNRWIFLLLPEIGFYHLDDECGFEVCWLCFSFEINNKQKEK